MSPVDTIAKALVDADPTMFGHHEDHVEAKRPAARLAFSVAIEAAARRIEETAVHKVGRIYAANLAASVRDLGSEVTSSPKGGIA